MYISYLNRLSLNHFPARDAGLRPSNHTDFFVAPLDQMFMMWSAVNRESREGNAVGPEQRVTPMEALKAQTLWAAEQYDEGHRRGSLEVGKIADLVILDGILGRQGLWGAGWLRLLRLRLRLLGRSDLASY